MKSKSKLQRNETPEVVTVLFVPQTPKGELARRLQVVESRISKLSGEKVKIVERGGTQVKQILHKSNPWSKGYCHRVNCLTCLHGDGTQSCFEKNIVYKISCKECEEKVKDKKIAVYVGQTSRSMYERGQEHLMGLRKMQETSPLFKHVSEEHSDNINIRFEMKLIKKHFSAISRLVHESVLIDRTSKANDLNILNSKGEWGRTHLPRLKIDQPLFEARDNLMKENNFSSIEKDWNVAGRKNLNVKAKRKVSSEKAAEDDREPLSNIKKKLATFSFSSNDIDVSSKVADKSDKNNGKGHKTQSEIYRFLASDPNFKVRKKMKFK